MGKILCSVIQVQIRPDIGNRIIGDMGWQISEYRWPPQFESPEWHLRSAGVALLLSELPLKKRFEFAVQWPVNI